MYDLASLNAARRHRHRSSHHGHRNRTSGMLAGKEGPLLTFAGRKAAEGLIGGWLGYMDAYSGEPMFFQTAGDASSGIGLKAGLALVSNGLELAQIFTGYSLGRKYGMLGEIADGALSGTASASWTSYMYLQGNTYGAAKRSKEKGGTGTAGLDYGAPAPRQMAPRAPSANVAGNDRVGAARAAAAVDPFNGYR